jgi:AraC-like DNA-binding protein/mannose-6-phosphate isomerase-like protein (cupin superfamily)
MAKSDASCTTLALDFSVSHNPYMVHHSSELTVRHYGIGAGSHSHDHFQVLWTLEGCLELEVEGKGVALAKGDGLLLRPGDKHDFEAPMGSRCLVLDTHDRTWECLPRHPKHALAASQLAAFLATAIDEKISIATETGPYLLAQTWGDTTETKLTRRPINWTDLSTWISERLAQPLVASDLSNIVHLSESQFRARCIEELGFSPMQLVRRLRLSKAQQLRNAGTSAAEAAKRVGYESPSALTAVLRRVRSS